jgi:hypothetical protein
MKKMGEFSLEPFPLAGIVAAAVRRRTVPGGLPRVPPGLLGGKEDMPVVGPILAPIDAIEAVSGWPTVVHNWAFHPTTPN